MSKLSRKLNRLGDQEIQEWIKEQFRFRSVRLQPDQHLYTLSCHLSPLNFHLKSERTIFVRYHSAETLTSPENMAIIFEMTRESTSAT